MIRFSQLFNSSKTRLENDANRTLSPVSIKQGDLVRHRLSNRIGRVTLVGTMSGSLTYPIISVDFEDGLRAIQVPAEDFTHKVKYDR